VKEGIVKMLRTDWNLVGAAHAHGISYECMNNHRRDDEEFRKAIDEAHDTYVERLRAEVHRRGVEGVAEPVFYQGNQVAFVQKYSDALLLAHIRKHDHSYREHTKVEQKTEHSGAITNVEAPMADLAPKTRKALRDLLRQEIAARAQKVAADADDSES
jgi:hypothetical protein